jgi:hypothetical protein
MINSNKNTLTPLPNKTISVFIFTIFSVNCPMFLILRIVLLIKSVGLIQLNTWFT